MPLLHAHHPQANKITRQEPGTSHSLTNVHVHNFPLRVTNCPCFPGMRLFPWDAGLSVLKPGKAWANWDELVMLFHTNIGSCQWLNEIFHSKPMFMVRRVNLVWTAVLMGPRIKAAEAWRVGWQSIRVSVTRGHPGLAAVLTWVPCDRHAAPRNHGSPASLEPPQ